MFSYINIYQIQSFQHIIHTKNNNIVFIIFIFGLQHPVCILYSQQISIWTSYISRAHQSLVTHGYCTEHHSFSHCKKSQEISIKIPASYVMDSNKLFLKFTWRVKRPRIANTVLKEKDKFGRLMLPDFKIPMKLQ